MNPFPSPKIHGNFAKDGFLLVENEQNKTIQARKKAKTSIPMEEKKKTSEIKVFPLQKLSKSSSISKTENKINRLFTSTPKITRKSPFDDNLCVKSGDSLPKKHNSTINMLNQIRVLIKAANVFRFRTKFRSLKFINENQAALLFDQSYFPEKQTKTDFLRRFTEKNALKKVYYIAMAFLYSRAIFLRFLALLEKTTKYLDSHVPVIKPFQKVKVFWDILILVTIVTFFFIVTLQLSFGFNYEQEFHDYLEIYHLSPNLIRFLALCPELLLVFDTLLKFITGYYENGLVVTKKKQIIHHYLKKGLFFDILSYFPIIMQSIFHETGMVLKILQLLLFCKLKRVQLIVNNFKEMISLNGKNDYILSLIILTFQIFFFCHICACIWHGVAFYYPAERNTWLEYAHISGFSWSNKYYYSLFWAVSAMVTVGFGEKISPQNNAELIVGVMILLSSSLVLGFTLNSMREIFDEMSKHKKAYSESLHVMNQYMKNKNINFELCGRVRKYLEYMMHSETNTEKENEILNKMTHALRKELILESNSKYIDQIPLFSNNFSKAALEELAFSLKRVRYSPEEFVFHENETNDCSIFIIVKGNIDLVHENSAKTHHIATLSVKTDKFPLKNSFSPQKSGQTFGAKGFFTSQPREISARSLNFSTVFEVKQADFLKIVAKYPEDFEKFALIKDELRFSATLQTLQMKCSCCSKPTHLISHCPLLHFAPSRDFLIKRHIFSPFQQRTAFQRRVPRKFNARFHNLLVQSAVFQLPSAIFSEEPEENQENQENQENPSFCEEGKGFLTEEENEIMEKSRKGKEIRNSEAESCENLRKIESFAAEDTKNVKESSRNSPLKEEQEVEGESQARSKGFSWKDEQIPVETPSKKESKAKILKMSQKFSTEVNLAQENKEFSCYNDVKIPSNARILRSNMKKFTVIKEKDEGKEKSNEKDKNNKSQIESLGLFDYEFEKMKEFSVYFPENNVKNVLKKLLEKKNSPLSATSKRSRNKWKLGKRVRTSKFLMDSIKENTKKSESKAEISKK